MITRWEYSLRSAGQSATGQRGEVEPVDEADVVPIEATGTAKGPFSHRCWRHSVDDIHGGQGVFFLTSSQAGIRWAKLQPRRPQMCPDRSGIDDTPHTHVRERSTDVHTEVHPSGPWAVYQAEGMLHMGSWEAAETHMDPLD